MMNSPFLFDSPYGNTGWRYENFTWPAGATQIATRFESGTFLRLRAFGPTLAAITLSTANLSTGVEHTIQITGSYRVA